MSAKQNYNERDGKQKGVFLRVFLPIFLILLVVFTALIYFVQNDDGEGGLSGMFDSGSKNIEDDITIFAGKNSSFAQTYKDVHRINVLLLGHNNKLTDTIMLASFDYDLKRVDIVSVPRDTYYERPAYKGAAYQKINSVYETEDIEGIAKAVSEVLCGVPIHYYMIISDDGVAKIVDSMGGVRFDVPIDMKYDDPEQGLFIDLKAGPQVLDGAHAVQYLRFRKGYPNADLGRIAAQQAFMKEAFKQSLSDFPKVIKTVISEVDTNLKSSLAARIAGEAVGMNLDNIETYMAPGIADMRNGASYYFVDEAATDEMMNAIYSMKAETEETSGSAVSDSDTSVQ
jgi:LCP family protein required for cell wall assembly